MEAIQVFLGDDSDNHICRLQIAEAETLRNLRDITDASTMAICFSGSVFSASNMNVELLEKNSF